MNSNFNAFKQSVKKIFSVFSAILGDYRKYKKFYNQLNAYNSLDKEKKVKKKNLFFYLDDATEKTSIDTDYYFQDLWAFDRIFKNKPEEHYDIGSSFIMVSYLSKFVKTTFVDIRPPSSITDSLRFIEGSVLNLPFENESISSLSSMCVIEHIGLGRYGDNLDPEGSMKAFIEVSRVIKPGGLFYFSLVVGDEDTVFFNAHRCFTEETIINFLPGFELIESKFIYDNKLNEKRNGWKNIFGCYIFRKL